MTDKWTDAQKNNIVLTHPYCEGKGCSKFGRIPPSDLRGDSMKEIA